ncbi:MAG TPA: orotate phosphoribosyltransferase [Legionellales bacterium]|nr:orotate phosphoribosyltransferase [Legionellales bacterium]
MRSNNKIPEEFKKRFIQFAEDAGVLKFGTFTLKSGRISPYFFNAGLFSNGHAASRLGAYYAHAITDAKIEFDMLFGPAYKGIPLVTLTAAALAAHHDINVPYAYNRKEIKAHGEGGNIVGAPLMGKVLTIDDVVTAGTAGREAHQLITTAGAENAGMVIALDRQEVGQASISAVQELEQALSAPVISIVKLQELIELLESNSEYGEFLGPVLKYRERYGC